MCLKIFTRRKKTRRGNAESIHPHVPLRSTQSQRASGSPESTLPALQRPNSEDVRATSQIPSASGHNSPALDTNGSTPAEPEIEGSEPTPQALQENTSDDAAAVSSHNLPSPDINESEPVNVSSHTVDPTAADKKKPRWTKAALSLMMISLDVLKEVPFPPVKAAAGILIIFVKNCEQTTANHKTIESLIEQVQDLLKLLNEPVPEGKTEVKKRREEFAEQLGKVVSEELEELQNQSNVAEFLNNDKDGKKLASLKQNIRDAMMVYQTALQQDNILISHENKLISHQIKDLTERKYLYKVMNPVKDAGYKQKHTRDGCLEGTRMEVLSQIDKWFVDKEDHRILWLNGSAGSGKSTIAQTIAENHFVPGELGASFFCSRDSQSRRDAKTIFPTLAFQLACQSPLFWTKLLQILETDTTVGQQSPSSDQLEKIIIQPLKEAGVPTLIIIDALDECEDEQQVSALLSALSEKAGEIPEAKFFISGRPEFYIREGFEQERTKVLDLYTFNNSSVNKDIELYFRTRLKDIPNKRKNCEFPKEWPTSSDIDALCKKAGGLFIYASTVVNFVAYKYGLPTESLDLILHSKSAAHEGDIDLLYTQVLELAFRNPRQGEEVLYSRFKNVVGAVLVVIHPLSEKALSRLLTRQGTLSYVSLILDFLHSVLNIPDNKDGPIQAFHKSFPDFLTNRSRCTDDRFFIDPAVHHRDILFSCLGLMKERLKRDICELGDYAILDEVNDLSALRKKHIGSSLEYACLFWTNHLKNVPSNGSGVQQVQEAMDEFFSKHLLSWIEVLSITGNLGGIVYAINRIRKWYTSAKLSTCEQADDGERLILEHFDAICRSPSHIYHSALPLSPSSSWIRECYKAEAVREVEVLVGLLDQWDPCSRTILFGTGLSRSASAFAHSGDTMAFGEGFHVVLLDTVTGSRTSVLSGHSHLITSLAFSLDGTLLVSSSRDETINLWDTETSRIIKTLHDIPRVCATSISQDNKTIALGTNNGAICFWEVGTWKHHFVKQPHSHSGVAIAFSPTNHRRLISSSWDGTVGKWDIDGHLVESFPHKNTTVQDTTYASDGTCFISCMGRVATIWDSESGAEVAELVVPDGGWIDRCCFSPDGRFVACSGNTTIYVWDINNLEAHPIKCLVGHSDFIRFIAFSSSSLISASNDNTVKIWPIAGFLKDSITTNGIAALRGSNEIKSVKLFPKHKTIVTSDDRGGVKTWDLLTGKLKLSFSTPAKGTRDTHLAGNTLTIVWYQEVECKYYIWDVYKGELLRYANGRWRNIIDLKISGDGSRVFGLTEAGTIDAVSMDTGRRAPCCVESPTIEDIPKFLFTHGSAVGINTDRSRGWDFDFNYRRLAAPDCREFPDRPRLDLVDYRTRIRTPPCQWIEDTVTKNRVFQLSNKHSILSTLSWDGRFLLIWSRSGDVMVVDFYGVSPDCIHSAYFQ